MLDFPATHKNREVIGDVLAQIYPPDERCCHLEIASGSGQHATYLARRFPEWVIQPSDIKSEHLASIAAYRAHEELNNVLDPLCLDVEQTDWGLKEPLDGIWAINLIHISPWRATAALFAGAKRHLKANGALYLYGAYRRAGQHTSPSNEAFDRGLQRSNPEWGVRCLDEVTKVAGDHGFYLDRVVEMPANNLSVVFRQNPS